MHVRPTQAIRMVEVLPAVFAFDAELALGNCALFFSEDFLDLARLYIGCYITPYTAIGADTLDDHPTLRSFS